MVRVCMLSDTHNKHGQVQVPECDLLIHAGDSTSLGSPGEVEAFLEWFDAQPATHKAYIYGNHEVGVGRDPAVRKRLAQQFPNLHYLEDSAVTLAGLKVYGSPYSAAFGYGWAFQVQRGPEARDHWAQIPDDTDILVTHGPALGFGDVVSFTGDRVGDLDLLERVTQVKPKVFCSGHLHQQPQQVIVAGPTTYVNASIVDDRYIVTNNPVVLEV